MGTEIIAQRLNDVRKARGWTLKRIADEVGTTQNTVCEHFKTGRFNTDWLIKYAECLGCTVADITDGTIDVTKFVLKDDITSYWPYNLAVAVAGGTDEKFFQVYVPGIMESLTELTDREQNVLKMRFMSGMTLEECGKEIGTQRERVRQVEARALRKLRHPRHWKRWHLDTMGKAIEEAKERSRLELENEILRSKLKNFMPEKDFMNPPEKPEPPKDLLIDDLELSVRSWNCLCRAGLRNVKDLSKISKAQLMKVRNLGRKSYEEVLEKLREVGVELAED